jgi:hypothetical protein
MTETGSPDNITLCKQYTECVSELGDFATHFFFLVRQHWGPEAAIAVLLTTLKHFSVQCSRGLEHNVLFAVEAFYKHGEQF